MPRLIELYLIRHAVAVPHDDWSDDRTRPLTSEGIEEFGEVVRGLDALGITLDAVLTSPFARAQQTAELLAAGLSPQPPVEIIESLAPDSNYPAFLSDLGRQAPRRRLACVGHEVELGWFASQLIGTKHPLRMERGGVCRIDLDVRGPGHLVWLAPPRLIRRG
jgi:phosphohistidine phosphatase